MKKLYSVLLCLLMLLAICACGKNTQEEATKVLTTQAPTTTEMASMESMTGEEITESAVAADSYADLSHLPEAKKLFFQKLGFAPSSLRTAFSGRDFVSTAHRGVVSVYSDDLAGKDKKKEAIVVSLLVDGELDRIQANYFYSGAEGLETATLLSTTLDYSYHPRHQDPPTLFLYRHQGKVYFCCKFTGGNEYGGGSFAHYGLVYTELLPSGKTADPVSLEYGHYAGQQWYATVFEGDEAVSFSRDEFNDGGDTKVVSFDAINSRLAEIGLLRKGAEAGDMVSHDREFGDDFVQLKEINEKTTDVTMLVSGSVTALDSGSYTDGIWSVEYIDHLQYDDTQ